MVSGIVAAFLIATLLTGILLLVFKNKGPWGSAWAFFLVLFLSIWTLTLYLRTMGPIYLGVPWLQLLLGGVLLMILLVAAIPPSIETERKPGKTGKIFWILIAIFAFAILVGMLNPQKAY